MKKPVVAIVGRPNVGKSTLVNRVIGARSAIVDDMPGVTRDRAYYDAEWRGREFQLIDTGGLIPEPEQEELFADLVNTQVEIAITEADVVVFVVDGQAGMTAVDETVAAMLRRTKKPVLVAVNKIDKVEQQGMAGEFYAMGFDEIHTLSAMHGDVGVGDLLDVVIQKLPDEDEATVIHDGKIRLSLIGRPNVGKSSILNALIGENRSIVSDVSGTTRDAINVTLSHKGQEYEVVDTAGIRKKGRVDYGVELFSVDRAIRSVRASDLCVIVLDATENLVVNAKGVVTEQDKKIIETSNEAGKGLIIVVNKWDLIPGKTSKTLEEYKKLIYRDIPHAQWAPILFTSAETGQRLPQVLEMAKTVYDNCNRRAKTSLINQVFIEAAILNQPQVIKNKRLKILYATQASVAPPTFILFVNDAKLLKDSYRRYLERKLRESFEFTGTPLVIIPRSRGDKE